jgi:cobalt-zinc-cadmium resistance protein CzcA
MSRPISARISDRNFPIVVRLSWQYCQSLDAIRHITIGAPNPSGSGVVPIPLTDVAKVSLVSGPSFIYRENQERYIPVKFSVRGRDLGGAVLEAQRKVAEQVPLPAGSLLEWVGEFGDLQEALERLEVVVPVSIALILLDSRALDRPLQPTDDPFGPVECGHECRGLAQESRPWTVRGALSRE